MYHTQYMYIGVQVHIEPEYADVGIQCDLPHNPVPSSNAGIQFGLCPLGASSPRTIPASCSESELSDMDDNVKVLNASTGTYYPSHFIQWNAMQVLSNSYHCNHE